MGEKMTAEEVEAFAAYAKNGCDCVGCGLTRKASRHIAALESELREKKCEAAMPVTAREGLTAEELDVLLGSLGTWTAADVRAHIAALEAERDEWKAEAEMKHAALTGVSRALDETAAERNAFRNRMADLSRELDWLFVALSTPAGVGLRKWAEKVVARMEAAEERVKELERRDKHLVESASNLATERDRLASRLAAIRQRASDKSALGRIALLHAEEPRGVVAVHVTRYILGEDAPAEKSGNPTTEPDTETRLADLYEQMSDGAIAGWLEYRDPQPLNEEHLLRAWRDHLLCVGEDALEQETKAEQPEANTAGTCECSRAAGHPDAPDCYDVDTVTPEVPAHAPDVCGPRPFDTRIICILPKGHPGGHSDGTDDDWRDSLRAAVSPPEPAKEPSTAEAFATLFAAGTTRLDEYERAALSLLERRMGAMRRALEELLTFVTEHPDFTDPKEADTYAAVEHARAAITDAPEVYTLEEIRGAFAHRADMDDHANVVLLEAMLERLATLRSK